MALHAIVQRVLNYILDTANRDRMDFAATSKTGESLADLLLPVAANYYTIYDAWNDLARRTPAKQQELEDAEKELIPLVRTLYTFSLKGGLFVTNADLTSMGLPTRNDERSPSPRADKAPGSRVELLEGDRVRVYLFDVDNNKKAKPPGQHGPEVGYGIYDNEETPVTPAELPHSDFTTRNTYTLQLDREMRGKFIKLAFRWENTRGEKGPWSEVYTFFIP